MGGDADLRMAEGIVEAIGPGLDTTGAVVADGGGLLVLPGMIDDHVYLDKTLTGLPWMPYPAGPSRASRIVTERGLRAQLPPPAERASNLVRQGRRRRHHRVPQPRRHRPRHRSLSPMLRTASARHESTRLHVVGGSK